MKNAPAWLPPLIRLDGFGGDWNRYIDHVFSMFYRDFVQSQPKFHDVWVRCRRDLVDGKEAGFWHCTSDGPDEPNRKPDLRRCERISWIRAVIEHAGTDGGIGCWPDDKRGEVRWLIWFNEEYLVVLAERIRQKDGFKYMQLITAYCTEQKHRKAKLRRQRDDYYKAQNS